MPYTSIATLSDGAILSAAHLNTLSANQEFLYGQSRQVNTPFISYRQETELLNVDDVYWTIRHRLRYFHYKVNCQENADYIKIFYDNMVTPIVNVTGPTLGAVGYVDLDPLGLTVGTRYQIVVDMFRDADPTEMTVDYLLESDSTSI